MQIENRMLVESEWESREKYLKPVEEVLREKGYHELGTNVFVPKEDAYEYALDRCLNGSEEDRMEFKAMLVEWFYSGNWIKED